MPQILIFGLKVSQTCSQIPELILLPLVQISVLIPSPLCSSALASLRPGGRRAWGSQVGTGWAVDVLGVVSLGQALRNGQAELAPQVFVFVFQKSNPLDQLSVLLHLKIKSSPELHIFSLQVILVWLDGTQVHVAIFPLQDQLAVLPSPSIFIAVLSRSAGASDLHQRLPTVTHPLVLSLHLPEHACRISIGVAHSPDGLVVDALLEVDLIDDGVDGASALLEFLGVPVLRIQTGSPNIFAVGRVLLVASLHCSAHVTIINWIKTRLHLAEDSTELLQFSITCCNYYGQEND